MKHLLLDREIFIENRRRFIAALRPASIAIFNSNDEVPSNADATYKFIQNSDLYWLTGIEQEDTMLIINTNTANPVQQQILVLVRPNPTMEKWIGKRLTKEQATDISGIENIIWLDALDAKLTAWIHSSENIYLNTIEHDRKPNQLPTRDYRFIKTMQRNYPLHNYLRSQPILQKIRSIKLPQEVAVMQMAVDITHKALNRVLRFIKPGVFEYEIEAEIVHEFLKNRASGEAYNGIFASGDNARVLHYIENNCECKDGELILMDFGAKYGGYCADLTRTVPVNGRFSPRQAELYNACLHLHNYAKSLLKPGVILADYHNKVADEATVLYLKMGLLTQAEVDKDDPTDISNRAYRKYTYHGISHFLGIDVHDFGSFTDPIEPGMVFTVEPGIYIEAEKIGIRIENNIVITETGNQDLFAGLPITVEEIEQAMADK